jgi:hypothetical protein
MEISCPDGLVDSHNLWITSRGAGHGTAISYDAMLAYFLVYNPQGELILARREEGERSHP